MIAEGNCKANIQAKDWVGKAAADILGLDLALKDDKDKVKLLIKGWIEAGHIHVLKRRCPIKREDKDFIDLVNAPHPKQGGAGKVLH